MDDNRVKEVTREARERAGVDLGRATALERSLAALDPKQDRAEWRDVHEESLGMKDRVEHSQQELDIWTKATRNELAESDRHARVGQREIVQHRPAPDKMQRTRPLGEQLLAEYRRQVRPVLEEQRDGFDSPFSPPCVIAGPLKTILAHHMSEVCGGECHEDEFAASRTHKFGEALVELMRELIKEERRAGGTTSFQARVTPPTSIYSSPTPHSCGPTTACPPHHATIL
jgi:hypothetical protein